MLNLNTQSVGASGALLLTLSFARLAALILDVHYLFSLANAVHRVHFGIAEDADWTAIITVLSPLLGMLVGGIVAYFGRPLTVHSTPPPSPGPDSGVSASPDANLKLAA